MNRRERHFAKVAAFKAARGSVRARPKPPRIDLTIYDDCRHRRGDAKLVPCQGCQGNVQVKVYDCAIHGECSTSARAKVQLCQDCGQFQK